MIITAQKALNIVSNHAVVKKVPELLSAVELFAEADRAYRPKKGCGDCKKADFFSPVENKALEAIANLSPDAILRLKAFLGVKDLYLNPIVPGKQATLRELK
jgi:hypothetical protein